MSDLVKRLRASIAMDAVHGDEMERGVCVRQMREAADEIERLTRDRDSWREHYTSTLVDKHAACDCLATCRRLLREAVLRDGLVDERWFREAKEAGGSDAEE